jgi:hypothetical protein
MLLAVAPDAKFEPFRQRVHDRNADAVQTARHLVGVLVELPARVQLGHDDLGRRHALFLVDLDRDAAAVVADRHARVRVDLHAHRRGMTGQRLVDAVVHDLVDHVVQARAVVGVADVHAGALAHRLQALENLDGIRAVVGRVAGCVGHASCPDCSTGLIGVPGGMSRARHKIWCSAAAAREAPLEPPGALVRWTLFFILNPDWRSPCFAFWPRPDWRFAHRPRLGAAAACHDFGGRRLGQVRGR